MSKAPKPISLSLLPTDISLLATIVEATKAGSVLYIPPVASSTLVTSGLVETNPAMSNADGLATRATQKGLYYKMSDTSQTQAAPVAAASTVAVPAMAIDKGMALPPIKRNSFGATKRAPAYPFADLEVGDNLHIAATGDAKLARVLAAAVSNANSRYAVATSESETVTQATYQVDAKGKREKVNGHFVKTGEKQVTRPKMKHEREFTLRSVDATDPRGAGFRVFRTL